jgi:hypothetical protein
MQSRFACIFRPECNGTSMRSLPANCYAFSIRNATCWQDFSTFPSATPAVHSITCMHLHSMCMHLKVRMPWHLYAKFASKFIGKICKNFLSGEGEKKGDSDGRRGRGAGNLFFHNIILYHNITNCERYIGPTETENE